MEGVGGSAAGAGAFGGGKSGLPTYTDLSWQQKAILGILRLAEHIEPVGDAHTAIKLYNDVVQRGRKEPITETDFHPDTLEKFRDFVITHSKQMGQNAGSIDYSDYRRLAPDINPNMLGGFQYNIDDKGNVGIKDTYDFNVDRGGPQDASPLYQTAGLLLNPMGVAASAGRRLVPDISGQGVPVRINIPNPAGVAVAGGPPLFGSLAPQ